MINKVRGYIKNRRSTEVRKSSRMHKYLVIPLGILTVFSSLHFLHPFPCIGYARR